MEKFGGRGDTQFWWGIEFSANKLAGFDSRLVPIVKKLVKTLMYRSVVAPDLIRDVLGGGKKYLSMRSEICCVYMDITALER